jgi:hypothetical protein
MSWLINWGSGKCGGLGRYGAVSLDASAIRALKARLALAGWRTLTL